MLDDRQITASSQWADPIWPPERQRIRLDRVPRRPPRAAPTSPRTPPRRGRPTSRGLPPTLIAVGAIDGFSDEDIDYAVRLRQAGVPVDLHVYAGAPHGFDGLAPGTAVARRANRDIEEWLGRRLAAG